MHLCTFTGIDENTHLSSLCKLSNEHKFIEWGVLYTYQKTEANPRYPSIDFIHQVNSLAKHNAEMNFAIHYCGKAAKDLISGETQLAWPYIKRVQLNIIAKSIKVDNLIELFKKNPQTQFIVQQNSNNEELNSLLSHINNHNILFDRSGGKGVSPESWPEAKEGKFCGFAGGLGLDNIAEQIALIDRENSGNDYWIDMESKIRNGRDVFDINVCANIAQIVAPYSKVRNSFKKINTKFK